MTTIAQKFLFPAIFIGENTHYMTHLTAREDHKKHTREYREKLSY